MDLQYHVDLLVAVNHEHHKALLAEAEMARLFCQSQQAGGSATKLSKMLGQVRGRMNALRTRVVQT